MGFFFSDSLSATARSPLAGPGARQILFPRNEQQTLVACCFADVYSVMCTFFFFGCCFLFGKRYFAWCGDHVRRLHSPHSKVAPVSFLYGIYSPLPLTTRIILPHERTAAKLPSGESCAQSCSLFITSFPRFLPWNTAS